MYEYFGRDSRFQRQLLNGAWQPTGESSVVGVCLAISRSAIKERMKRAADLKGDAVKLLAILRRVRAEH